MLSPDFSLSSALSAGPPVVDVQRNYLFSATLFKVDWVSSLIQGVESVLSPSTGAPNLLDTFSKTGYRYINPLLMIPAMEYISFLIKEVDQPQQGVITEERRFGPLKVQVPVSVSMDPFTITFVEEIGGMVEYFFRNFFLELTGGNSMTFAELKRLSVSMLFTRNATGLLPGVGGQALAASNRAGLNGQGQTVEAPVNVYFYPNVLPVKYEIDPWDKSGDTFVTSKITFVRVPNVPKLNDRNGMSSFFSQVGKQVAGFNPYRFL